MTLVGITPAYAGKRAVFQLSLALTWDHPRLCGEKICLTVNSLYIQGSPPPMRGKVSVGGCNRGCHRITPAYAGKSMAYHHRPIYNQDHPRLCGEKKLMRIC